MNLLKRVCLLTFVSLSLSCCAYIDCKDSLGRGGMQFDYPPGDFASEPDTTRRPRMCDKYYNNDDHEQWFDCMGVGREHNSRKD